MHQTLPALTHLQGWTGPCLDTLPPGVVLPIKEAFHRIRSDPPSGWPSSAYALIGREDMAATLRVASEVQGGAGGASGPPRPDHLADPQTMPVGAPSAFCFGAEAHPSPAPLPSLRPAGTSTRRLTHPRPPTAPDSVSSLEGINNVAEFCDATTTCSSLFGDGAQALGCGRWYSFNQGGLREDSISG